MLSRPCGAPFPHSGLLLCTPEDICSSHVQNVSLCSENIGLYQTTNVILLIPTHQSTHPTQFAHTLWLSTLSGLVLN